MKHTDKLYLIKLAAQQPSTWGNIKGYAPHLKKQYNNVVNEASGLGKGIKSIYYNNNLTGDQWKEVGNKFGADVANKFQSMVIKPIKDFDHTLEKGFNAIENDPIAAAKDVGKFVGNQAQKVYENPARYAKNLGHGTLNLVGGMKLPYGINYATNIVNATWHAGEGNYNQATTALAQNLIPKVDVPRVAEPIKAIGKNINNTAADIVDTIKLNRGLNKTQIPDGHEFYQAPINIIGKDYKPVNTLTGTSTGDAITGLKSHPSINLKQLEKEYKRPIVYHAQDKSIALQGNTHPNYAQYLDGADDVFEYGGKVIRNSITPGGYIGGLIFPKSPSAGMLINGELDNKLWKSTINHEAQHLATGFKQKLNPNLKTNIFVDESRSMMSENGIFNPNKKINTFDLFRRSKNPFINQTPLYAHYAAVQGYPLAKKLHDGYKLYDGVKARLNIK